MTEPLVSVKMITYNHAPYIAQAIEGVLQQKTNLPFELVIGEDCSTDGTREIAFEFQKKYPDIIRVITSERNIGARKNAYRATKACRGEYVAFCEGDDYWQHPDKLQKQVDYLESHPECGMVFADCDVYHNRGKSLRKGVRNCDGYRSPLKLSIEQIVGSEKIGRWPWTCTAMVRRALYEQVIERDPYLHQSDQFLLGDVQLWAELSLVSEVSYIPESLATYRINDESATNNIDPRKILLFWISISEMKMYLCDKHKLSEDLRRKSELIWLDKSLQLALYGRNPELAMKVKRQKQTLTWKEWLWYFGSKNVAIHYTYRSAVSFLNLFRKENDSFS